MQFNSVKGSNFTSAAKSLNKSTAAIFDASRTSAPDFTGISKQSIVSRTKERNAATEAKGLVERTNIKADSLIDRTKLKIKTEKDVADIKRPAKRMAGVVAGLGALSTGVINMKEAREAKAERASLKLERDKITKMTKDFQAQSVKDLEEVMELYRRRREEDTPSTKPSTSTSTSSGISTTPPTGTPTNTSKGTLYSKSDLQSFAIQAGFTPSEATTMSKIGLAESGGFAGNDTVQSGLDPGQNDEYSIGLWQINTKAHMDKLTKHGWNKEDLRDPVKNATIAKEVYDEMGGSFEPWGAYTNGSYQKH